MIDEQLLLENIRSVLIRQEESIIFSLIERAQYCVNAPAHTTREFPTHQFTGSLCDFYVHQAEQVDALIGRFTSPDEHPFSSHLPQPILSNEKVESPIMDYGINMNTELKNLYINKIIPLVCKPGDDHNYGSSTVADHACLKVLSRRIHYGMFVAESKYLANPKEYQALVKSGNDSGIIKLLTDKNVEQKLLLRVALKASTYGQEPGECNPDECKITANQIVRIYKEWLMPLTKEIELQYLKLRGKENV
jgi:chorismate mutase